MKPETIASAMHSITLASTTIETMETSKNGVEPIQKMVKPIPIIEPMPHYPLSANISDMMAHINELISQKTTKLVTEINHVFSLEKHKEQKKQSTQQGAVIEQEGFYEATRVVERLTNN
ncbi:hypothetical protein [Bartonella schoenbuchensis]|uniref:Uncharacterized protein n=1 Tax=Bartonella schoenbuchensis m07a TaxID=1094496 RepID=N6VJA7_9HYPH|nr:hypothetical protein [Bartonella schoenbuchensis]ENN91097.1 hypothetical protein m07a_11090 [Bartonella schoenbuchensis m07a]